MSVRLSVIAIGRNERHFLSRCLDSLLDQDSSGYELYYLDNGSVDRSIEYVRKRYGRRIGIIASKDNLGCSGARNLAIDSCDEEAVLTCDANAFFTPSFLGEMLKPLEKDRRIGMVQGKIIAASPVDAQAPEVWRIDTTGIVLTKDRRNHDRGQGQRDRGQFDRSGFVFGPGGCAPLYRRSMLDRVRLDGVLFDETMFIYREEVDFAWRCQLLGWKCYYTAEAVGFHTRTYAPKTRRSLPGELRRLQYRNRYLMIYKNDRIADILHDLPKMAFFEIKALVYLFLFEPDLLHTWVETIALLPGYRKIRKQILGQTILTKCERRKLFG